MFPSALIEPSIFDAARVVIPFVLSFSVGILLAPILTHYLYRYRVWKKIGGKAALDGTEAVEFNRLHKEKEGKTPRMGGLLIWITTLVTAFGLMIFSGLAGEPFASFDFVNRGQTWLPLAALLFGGAIGFVNDLGDVREGGPRGLSLPARLAIISSIALLIGWWFYEKLEVSAVGVPFIGPLELGILFIPVFIVVTLAIYASGVIDGIDGLAGGIFAIVFMTYAGIAFAQSQFSLAAFAATVSGAIFAFLWFNIPPARFWMTETGTMALTLALAVTAFSADVLGDGVGVAVLPIIALPLTATVLSNVLQIFWKKVFNKKLFRIAPLHHHFEAIGWPSYKVTMRYWVITIIAGVFGLSIALLQ